MQGGRGEEWRAAMANWQRGIRSCRWNGGIRSLQREGCGGGRRRPRPAPPRLERLHQRPVGGRPQHANLAQQPAGRAGSQRHQV